MPAKCLNKAQTCQKASSPTEKELEAVDWRYENPLPKPFPLVRLILPHLDSLHVKAYSYICASPSL